MNNWFAAESNEEIEYRIRISKESVTVMKCDGHTCTPVANPKATSESEVHKPIPISGGIGEALTNGIDAMLRDMHGIPPHYTHAFANRAIYLIGFPALFNVKTVVFRMEDVRRICDMQAEIDLTLLRAMKPLDSSGGS